MKYSAACELVGFDPRTYSPPKPVYAYFGYGEGKVTEFLTWEEAKRHSTMSEKVQTNKIEVENYWVERRKQEARAAEIWSNALKADYIHLPKGVYELCYDRAYESGHLDGYDSVAEDFRDLVYFVEKIIALARSPLR